LGGIRRAKSDTDAARTFKNRAKEAPQEGEMTSDADIELIEHMAQAIRETFGNRSGRARPWSEIPSTLRQSYRAEARAALRALREHSDGKLALSYADKQVALSDQGEKA
jgi:hypothetical protein